MNFNIRFKINRVVVVVKHHIISYQMEVVTQLEIVVNLGFITLHSGSLVVNSVEFG